MPAISLQFKLTRKLALFTSSMQLAQLPLDEVRVSDESAARVVSAICTCRTGDGVTALSQHQQAELLQACVAVGALIRQPKNPPQHSAHCCESGGFKEARLAYLIRSVLRDELHEDLYARSKAELATVRVSQTVGNMLCNYRLWHSGRPNAGWTLVAEQGGKPDGLIAYKWEQCGHVGTGFICISTLDSFAAAASSLDYASASYWDNRHREDVCVSCFVPLFFPSFSSSHGMTWHLAFAFFTRLHLT
jgi:hypothetical protein